MNCPSLPASRTAKLCGVYSLVAVVDPTFLFLAGFAIALFALFVTWRPLPRSKL